MLVLRRKIDEVIVIEDNIRIKVLGIRWDDRSVKLGIEAPRFIKVLREEVSKGEDE